MEIAAVAIFTFCVGLILGATPFAVLWLKAERSVRFWREAGILQLRNNDKLEAQQTKSNSSLEINDQTTSC